MTVTSILANTLGGPKSLARIPITDPATGQPAVDLNGNPVVADWSQDPVVGAAVGTPTDAVPSDLTAAASMIALLRGSWSNGSTGVVALGTPGDEPWSGSGEASIIALLKALVLGGGGGGGGGGSTSTFLTDLNGNQVTDQNGNSLITQ
jgi:hypothetical protein